ncbi:MAG: hypothetical protein ACYDB3_04860, partial [Acidimicrobiales bacterium]
AEAAVTGITNCAASEGAPSGVCANVVRVEMPDDDAAAQDKAAGNGWSKRRAEEIEACVALAVHMASRADPDVTSRCIGVPTPGTLTDFAAETGPLVALTTWNLDEIAEEMSKACASHRSDPASPRR